MSSTKRRSFLGRGAALAAVPAVTLLAGGTNGRPGVGRHPARLRARTITPTGKDARRPTV
jgi:hypothetical protein